MKVKFHGILKKLCPKEFYEVVADTPAEAIRAVTMQLKSLRRVGGNRWLCRVKECPEREDLYAHRDVDTELNLYPDYSPAGGGSKPGVLQVIVGVVIIVIAVVTTWLTGGFAAGFWAAFYTSAGGLTLAGSAAVAGVGMILSGLATMIMTPDMDTKETDSQTSKSRTFGSSKNTTEIGTRIAIGYGKYKVYGQFLSINTQTFDS